MAFQLSLPLVLFAGILPFLNPCADDASKRILPSLLMRLFLFNLIALGIHLTKDTVPVQEEVLAVFQVLTALFFLILFPTLKESARSSPTLLPFPAAVPLLLIILYAFYLDSPFLILNLYALGVFLLHLSAPLLGGKLPVLRMLPAASVLTGFLLLAALGPWIGSGKISLYLSSFFEGTHSPLILIPLMFSLGFLTSLGPSTLPFLPLVFGVLVTRRKTRGEIFKSVLGFALAFVITHSTVGVLASAGAIVLTDVFRVGIFSLLLSLLLLLIALNLLNVLPFRLNLTRISPFRNPGMNSLLLGIAYTFSLCPSCTSLLLGAVVLSASTDSLPLSALYMGIYATGRAVPVFLSGIVVEKLSGFLKRNHLLINRLVGVLFLFLSLFFFKNFLEVFP